MFNEIEPNPVVYEIKFVQVEGLALNFVKLGIAFYKDSVS